MYEFLANYKVGQKHMKLILVQKSGPAMSFDCNFDIFLLLSLVRRILFDHGLP